MTKPTPNVLRIAPTVLPAAPASRVGRKRKSDVSPSTRSTTTKRRGAKATAQRRGYAIRAYIGANGHGKSLAMVADCLPSLEAGRPVLSNVRLLDYANPRPCDDPTCEAENHATHYAAHPLWVPLTDYSQLLEARSCDVLLDEVTGIASSRESSSLPVQVVNLLVQLRRRDVTLSWTAPAWARADKVLREVTQMVVVCRGMAPADRTTADGTRTWRDRRLFWLRGYDATLFDEFTSGKREKLKPSPMQLLWRPGSDAERAYDTLDAVTALGWAMESGLCMACGGRRSVPRCSCDDHGARERKPPEAAAPRPRERRLSRAERREATLTGETGVSAGLTVLPGV